jgi:hypothetical protein
MKGRNGLMRPDETASDKLRRESQELRETALDMIEHAALLIAKSVQIDKHVVKSEKK